MDGHWRFQTPHQPWYTAAWGRVAQLAEQLTLNQRVRGSSPRAPTNEIKGLGCYGLTPFCIKSPLSHRQNPLRAQMWVGTWVNENRDKKTA